MKETRTRMANAQLAFAQAVITCARAGLAGMRPCFIQDPTTDVRMQTLFSGMPLIGLVPPGRFSNLNNFNFD